MARMGRELSLVLLGAGILTAGYFLWPEEDLEARAEQEAAKQVAGSHHSRAHYGHLVYLHTGRWGGGTSSPAKVPISRGGFGSIGKAISGGGA